ncbi:MAG: hypothetical protein F7C33_02220 [Desulfurococcales archaeon]|nr:hypothetical protein [Desulfurococcales archaeon]
MLYDGFAVDRMHFNPWTLEPLPKGCPEPPSQGPFRAERPWGAEEVRSAAEKVLSEARVLDAAEYEAPRRTWRVPVAWRSLIVIHLRIDESGRVVPDEPLTMELRRRLP